MAFGIGGLFVVWFLFVFALVLVPLGFTVYALVDVIRAPDAAFGPPWDNSKGAWTLGMALALVIPAGVIVGPILWWIQVRGALKERRQVPRPFWSPRPATPYPYPYPAPPPVQQGQQGQPPQQPPA